MLHSCCTHAAVLKRRNLDHPNVSTYVSTCLNMSLYLSDKTRSVSWTQGDGSERAKHFPQRPSSNREAAAAKLQLAFWTCTTLCVEWRIQCNLLHDHAAVLKIFENLLNSLASAGQCRQDLVRCQRLKSLRMMLRQAPKAAGLRSTYEEQGMFDKTAGGAH